MPAGSNSESDPVSEASQTDSVEPWQGVFANELHSGHKSSLNKPACSCVMTTMYCARLARDDLLRASGHLACNLTCWTEEMDRRLKRTYSYMIKSKPYRKIGFVGDSLDKCWLSLFADSYIVGDKAECKSTSGALLVLRGPNTYFPVGAVARKQSTTALSTP